MRLALEQAALGMKRGEIPIGATIARMHGGTAHVLGSAHNRNIELRCRHAHAEMEALANATAHLRQRASLTDRSVPLDDGHTVLVSTLEPCIMCFSAAIMSYIHTIVYALEAPLDGGSSRVQGVDKDATRMPEIVGGVMRHEARALFESWAHAHAQSDRHWNYVTRLLDRTRDPR